MKLALVISIALVSIASIGALSARGTSRQTLTFVTHQHTFAQIDVGKHGFSLGDQFIFSEQLMQNGKQVGHDHIICSHVANWPSSAEGCTGTATIGPNTLVLLGDASRGPFTIAVVGGTGAYAGARGTARVNSHGNSGTLTVSLL